MPDIEKNDPPQALLFWKAQRNAAAQSLDFAELGRVEMNGEMEDVKKAIKSQRLKDQGFLCAYTMLRITADTSHIEHLIPQSLSRIEKHREQTVLHQLISGYYYERTSIDCKFTF